MNSVQQRLRDVIGLDLDVLGTGSLARAVANHMEQLGFRDFDAYDLHLAQSQSDWAELVESLLVTETWFFREPEALLALGRLAKEKWLVARPSTQLRLLSVPCSTGEEPASVAMTLLEAGLPPSSFQITGVDLSAQALARAEKGRYGLHSFRALATPPPNGYFRPEGGSFILEAGVRDRIHYTQDNLFMPRGRLAGPYDFIFCRNLLIYLNAQAQRAVLCRLESLLAPEGLLFVAAAEQSLVAQYGFVSQGTARAAAFHRPQRTQNLTARASLSALMTEKPEVGSSRNSAVAKWAGPQDGSFTRGELMSKTRLELDHAYRLADAGYLMEAAILCEAYLRRERTSAHGYYLLGLIREAAGVPTAGDCYRRALYLDPNHHSTLLQMARLSLQSGDNTRATNFRRRAERAQQAGF